MPSRSFLDELAWRGLLFQQTEGAPAVLNAGPLTAYCGFDPTADSLHVGSLVPVMGLVHLQRAGHRPIALVGGGTGMIGDPSGKTSERQLLDAKSVEKNAAGIHAQLERFLDFDGPRGALMRNNADWLSKLSMIDFLRDVGKHFSVNVMLARESVKGRMETGISFTEFSYMLLQAYDFVELNRRDGCTMQIGGSDQWGNIVAGIDLVRRLAGADAHGVTLPLVTTSAGTKFGKTESGAVWLDAERTSPYAFYQFWYNADDRDAGRWLRFFTLKDRAEIDALDAETAASPERRAAQQALALDVTTRVHGERAASVAVELSGLLFGKGDPRSLSEDAFAALAREVPFAVVDRRFASDDTAAANGGLDALDLFTAAGLAASRGAAKRLVEQGGAYVNGERVQMSARTISAEQLLPGGHVLLRKGAREYGLVRVTE